MIFYIIKAVPNFIVATQAEAKKASREYGGAPWGPHEVPTDKAGLMAYINDLMMDSASILTDAVTPVAKPAEQCRSCASRDPVALERGAKALAAGANGNAIAERIMELDGFELGLVLQAVPTRLKQLAERIEQ